MGSTDLKFCVIDFETYSVADLKKVGATEYARHKSTEILCLSYAYGTRGELQRAAIASYGGLTKTRLMFFEDLIADPDAFFVAHNAGFERAIFSGVLGLSTPVEKWKCTAALARTHGLPGALSGAALALGLSHQKDTEGRRLMLRMSKPKKPSKKDPSTRYGGKERLTRLMEYCRQDVKVEKELFLSLDPIHPVERRFWFLDQKMNERGFNVDRTLCKSALRLIGVEGKKNDAKARALTGGALNSTRQTAALLKVLEGEGVKAPNLQAQTITDLLTTDLPPKARTLLELRRAASRSSTAKYQAFEARSRSDGRARDNTIFFGAHTGRQAGTGLQPQNLFKTVLPQRDVDIGIDLMRLGDLHTVEAFFDSPMDLYASALRGAIVSAPGHILDVGDFSTIEVRVLFWLADHPKGLEALRLGRDIYIDMAAYIYDLNPETLAARYQAHDKDAGQKRQLGKQTVLGAGYGIGVNGEKFQETCARYGIEIPLDLASNAIRAYRKLHYRVCDFWGNLERGAFQSMANPGKAFSLRNLTFRNQGEWLTVQLPSGRRLKYFKPEVARERTLYGDHLSFSYMGVHSPTKAFERVSTWGGKLAENVVQAVSADLLFEALGRLEIHGPSRPVLAVHDEIVAERPRGVGSTEEFLTRMAEVPTWAKGLPLKVEGWSGGRYRK